MNLSLQVRELRKKGKHGDSHLYSYLEKIKEWWSGINTKLV